MSGHVEEFESVGEHDTRTANTQINTSRTFLSIASAFAAAGCFPWLADSYSSAFDAMKFALAMRAASYPGHIYRGVQFGSDYGKKIVSSAIAAETGLLKMIYAGRRKDYSERIMAAKKALFGAGERPILSDEAMKQFGPLDSPVPNSDISVVQLVVDAAESGRDLFEDLKATTPMYTSLVCMADWLFNSPGRLERAVAAPFEVPGIRVDDLDFHDEIKGWSDALLLDSRPAYDSRHAMMRERLEAARKSAVASGMDDPIEKSLQRSKKVTSVCREAMAERFGK
jgi:prephenate dehydrogenase (NADP+)